MKKKFEDLWEPSSKMGIFWVCGFPLIYIGLYLVTITDNWIFLPSGVWVYGVWLAIGCLLEKKVWRPNWYRAMDENAISQGRAPNHTDKYK